MNMNYRFRSGDKGELVLQVMEYEEPKTYSQIRKATWRDATVEDLPVVRWLGAELNQCAGIGRAMP